MKEIENTKISAKIGQEIWNELESVIGKVENFRYPNDLYDLIKYSNHPKTCGRAC